MSSWLWCRRNKYLWYLTDGECIDCVQVSATRSWQVHTVLAVEHGTSDCTARLGKHTAPVRTMWTGLWLSVFAYWQSKSWCWLCVKKGISRLSKILLTFSEETHGDWKISLTCSKPFRLNKSSVFYSGFHWSVLAGNCSVAVWVERFVYLFRG